MVTKRSRKSGAAAAADADVKITHRAATLRDTPLVRVAGAASEVADQPPLIAIASGTIALGAVLERPVLMRSGVRMLASHLIATGIKSAVKHSIDRTRPAVAIARGRQTFERGDTDHHDVNSFPSGHTAGAVAIAQAIARDTPAAAIPARVAALSVAAIQMPRGKHYIGDVIVGAAIGWASEQLASSAFRFSWRLWASPAKVPDTKDGVSADSA